MDTVMKINKEIKHLFSFPPPYWMKQWAAVMIQRGVMMAPPHTCFPLQCKLLCQPHLSSANIPPIILQAFRPAPTGPRQPEGEWDGGWVLQQMNCQHRHNLNTLFGYARHCSVCTILTCGISYLLSLRDSQSFGQLSTDCL